MKIEEYAPQEPLTEQGAGYKAVTLYLSSRVSAGEEFAYGDDPCQRLIVHPAAKPNGTVLAFTFGGGWTNGYKEMMGYMAPAFTARGVTFASIGYRLAPMHPWPACFEDCAAAMSWLVKTVADKGGDPKRIFLGGRSAGGHLSSLLAVRRDWQARHGVPTDVIRGCIPVSGVYLFGEGAGFANRPRFLGPVEQKNEIAASPLRNIQSTPPPFFMARGEKDFPHLIRQADDMMAALKQAGALVELEVLPDCDHLGTGVPTGDPNSPWMAKAHAFMAAH